MILKMDKDKEEKQLIRQIKNLAEYQMRKSTHVQFLEACIAESVVPQGLLLQKQVQIGDNQQLQQCVNRLLEKTSLEMCRMIRDEHVRQQGEAKGKMATLEQKLSSSVNDRKKMFEINSNVFKTTEDKKNVIVERQRKKLESLKNKRKYINTRAEPSNEKSVKEPTKQMPQTKQKYSEKKPKQSTNKKLVKQPTQNNRNKNTISKTNNVSQSTKIQQ